MYPHTGRGRRTPARGRQPVERREEESIDVNIYVGNLSYKARDEDLRAAFEPFGQVSSARVISDKETGRSRGFGFVEMPNDEEARKAIEAVNNKDIAGRAVRVNEARPREDRPPR